MHRRKRAVQNSTRAQETFCPPHFDDNNDTVLEFMTPFRYIRENALSQPSRPSHDNVFTFQLFAHHWLILSLSASMCYTEKLLNVLMKQYSLDLLNSWKKIISIDFLLFYDFIEKWPVPDEDKSKTRSLFKIYSRWIKAIPSFCFSWTVDSLSARHLVTINRIQCVDIQVMYAFRSGPCVRTMFTGE